MKAQVRRRGRHRRRTWTRLLLWAAAALGGCSRENANDVWKQGEDALRARQFDQAQECVTRLARLRSPTPLDWMLRAQVALARDRTDEALADLRHVPDDHIMGAQARLLSGQVELRRGRVRVAEQFLREAVRIDPKLVGAHRELIYIYGVQSRRAELAREFRILSELTELTFDNIFHWCLTRNSVWEPVEITEMMSRFIKADPEDRWSRLALAESQRQQGLLDEAEKTLEPLPASDPEGRAVRVRIALDRGQPEEAEGLLAEGPQNNADLARLRGRIALARGDGPAALQAFRAAYAAEPDNRDTIFGLANALQMVGRDDEAAPFLKASRAQDVLGTLVQRASTTSERQDPRLLHELGAACEAVHRLPEAKAWYKLAIARNPLDERAQQAIFRLDRELAARGKANRQAGETGGTNRQDAKNAKGEEREGERD